jgi:WD40 repeat protein
VIKVWDAEKGLNITNLKGHTGDINTVKWSNDNVLCGSGGADKTIRFWDLREYRSTSLISAIKYSDINDLSILTKNKVKIVLIPSQVVPMLLLRMLVELSQYGIIRKEHYSRRYMSTMMRLGNEIILIIRSVSFSPDGKYLVSGSFDSRIKIFDVEKDFDLIGELTHLDRVVSVKWHPEVPILLSTSADKTAKIWVPDN